jgi:hypothetical protein
MPVLSNHNQSQISQRTATTPTVNQEELDDHARSIRKQLKSLRRETEYARKLILNEKKIDHLLGVLDRSKE